MKNENNKKGLSLIVLIVSIIVIIVLAAAIIITINKNNPIESAKEAAFKEDIRKFQDELAMWVSNDYIVNQGKRDKKISAKGYIGIKNVIKDFKDKYSDILAIQNDELVYITNDQKKIKWCEEIGIKPYTVNITEIFDENGKDINDSNYDSNKLHVGDFITYDAGIWSESEINEIKTGIKGYENSANNSNDAPTFGYQFGGFKVGDSKNSEVLTATNGSSSHTPHKSVADGWRIFDVDRENNTISLVSAGCTELYNHPSQFTANESNIQYTSLFILVGNSRGSWYNDNNLVKRDFSNYINRSEYAFFAKALDINDINMWYAKYLLNTSSANIHSASTFNQVFKTQYETIIDNNSTYWLCSSYYSNSLPFIDVSPSKENAYINGGYGQNRCGIRILVKLSSDAKVEINPKKRTVTNARGEDYTYNVWNLIKL